MKVQQVIILIMLTSIICVFLGLTLDGLDNAGKLRDMDLSVVLKVVIFGFTMIIWIYTIIVIDLYLSNRNLRKDMNTHLACSKTT